MDYGLYSKIKERDWETSRNLQETELPWAYFVCYRLKRNVGTAAKLLKLAWMETLSGILSAERCPKWSFQACLSKEIYRLSDEKIPPLQTNPVFWKRWM
ncbi:MAG: hypothetical protein IKW18_01545, partial [Clostridia bacterium]|nr:hypothetical protein [Clostridia bacterium]